MNGHSESGLPHESDDRPGGTLTRPGAPRVSGRGEQQGDPLASVRSPVLAIVSPTLDRYSETFIAAHRRLIDADVRFYYGGWVPHRLEGRGSLHSDLLVARAGVQLRKRMMRGALTTDQVCFCNSLRREGVEVVLAEYGQTAAGILPVCRRLGLPMIVHYHGIDASSNEVLDEYGERYKEVFDYASHVVAVSRQMEEKLLSLGCPREKLVYTVCGPDDEFFEVEVADPAPPRFAVVGRFIEKKAPHYSLLAFRKVLASHPDAEMVMIGDGPLRPVCGHLITYFDMRRNVSLPGPMTPDQIRGAFERCAALVQHSVTAGTGNMEGTPVTVLEAAAAGLPVVATRHAGIPDVVVHGETGLLVDEHDVEGMAANMCTILEQPDYGRAMGRAGRRRIRENFTMSRHIATLNELVCGSLNRH
ncbi:MAG: glycosyltransferase [Arenicellales bacterium]